MNGMSTGRPGFPALHKSRAGQLEMITHVVPPTGFEPVFSP